MENAFLGTPRLEVQHPDIFPGSPMALVAIFAAIIQDRFKKEQNLPWYREEDPTPEETEENTEEAPRKIYIESQYTQFPTARNFRPAILVDKLETRFLKIVLGNRGHFDMPRGIDFHICHAQTIISIANISVSRGESANLAEHVAMHLLANKNSIRETFSIHDISEPIIGATNVYRRSANENDTWNTPINLEITLKYLWRVTTIAPVLNEIKARFTTIQSQSLSLYNKEP